MNPDTNINNLPYMVFSVEGMTCNHCKSTVENGVSSIENVELAEADIQNNTLKVFGNNLDPGAIEKTITRLNYIFKGQMK